MHRILTVLALLVILGACEKPEPAGPAIGKHVLRPGEPPPEAFVACNGKAPGITCQFGHLVGTCQLPESGEPRPACVTENRPGVSPSK